MKTRVADGPALSAVEVNGIDPVRKNLLVVCVWQVSWFIADVVFFFPSSFIHDAMVALLDAQGYEILKSFRSKNESCLVALSVA